MASVSRVKGFSPVRSITGAPYNGAANVYFIPASDATAVYVGDVVKLAGDSRTPAGVPTVTRAGATDQIVGVVVGLLFTGIGDTMNVPPVTSLDTPVYRVASTDRYVLVADDPNLVFEAQCNAAITSGDIGLNVSPTTTAGSSTTGVSGEGIDMSTKATTATLPFKLVAIPQRPDNQITDTYVNAYVVPNNHVFKGGTGTTGT